MSERMTSERLEFRRGLDICKCGVMRSVHDPNGKFDACGVKCDGFTLQPKWRIVLLHGLGAADHASAVELADFVLNDALHAGTREGDRAVERIRSLGIEVEPVTEREYVTQVEAERDAAVAVVEAVQDIAHFDGFLVQSEDDDAACYRRQLLYDALARYDTLHTGAGEL